jgi:hypothetical protein
MPEFMKSAERNENQQKTSPEFLYFLVSSQVGNQTNNLTLSVEREPTGQC